MATVDHFWAEAKSELKADARRQLEARSASRQPDLCAKVLPEPVGPKRILRPRADYDQSACTRLLALLR
jgi:hypothetical protein